MTLSDRINRMIEIALTGAKITSASPGHINTVFLLEEMDHTGLDDEIRTMVEEEVKLAESSSTGTSKKSKKKDDGLLSEQSKVEKEIKKFQNELIKQKKEAETNLQEIELLKQEAKNSKEFTDKIKELEKVEEENKIQLSLIETELKTFNTTSLKDLQGLTGEQVRNLKGITRDPFQFLLTNFFKKFAKGAGVLALATIIFAAVQMIIMELMKPGRALDRRFRRVAKDEIFLFNSREEQAELRQGFRTVTITTMPFLRGADQTRGQISGNLYNPTAIPMNRIDPRRAIAPPIKAQISSRRSVFFERNR